MLVQAHVLTYGLAQSEARLAPELVGEVVKAMRDLSDDGRSKLVVAHEMGFARDGASRVIFLCEGRVDVASPRAKPSGRAGPNSFRLSWQTRANSRAQGRLARSNPLSQQEIHQAFAGP